jgi:hypothetical protein
VPSENLAVPKINQIYYLNISRKKKIVNNLIFLSIISDESLKIMAVCVKEYCNGGITIRVASNIGDLSTVVRKFIKLAKILEQIAR